MDKQKTTYKQTGIGEIPEDWDVISMSGVVDIATGKLNSNAAVDDGPYPFFTCSPDTLKINTHSFDQEAVLLAGNNAEGKFNIKFHKGKFDAYQRTYVINSSRGDRLTNRYLFYSLENLLRYFQEVSVGSATRFLTLKILNNLPLALPDVDEQQQIAFILSSLDDKIELNRKMNKTLEEIGKALFKHWFVDFEFPNEEGKPYKSSGGEMVESELGKIPRGWKIVTLSDFGNIICGKTPPKTKSEYYDGDVPFIKIPDMHNQVFVVQATDSLSAEGLEYQKQKILPKNSICVSCIATVGLVCITSQTSQTNQQINSIVPTIKCYREYLYYKLSSMNQKLKDYASGGSATLNLNTGSFAKIRVVKPTEEMLKMFSIATTDLFERVLMNENENLNLTSIRDSFLPRLMSGRLRIII